MTPKATTKTAMVTQLASGVMLPATRSVSTLFEISITPPTATLKRSNIHSITPSRPKNAARVTMNAGSRSRVMSVPRTRPITVQRGHPDQDAQPPGKVPRRRHQGGHQAGTDAGVVNDGQVDLAQQEDEDLGHGEDSEHHQLVEEVDEVAGRQVLSAL